MDLRTECLDLHNKFIRHLCCFLLDSHAGTLKSVEDKARAMQTSFVDMAMLAQVMNSRSEAIHVCIIVPYRLPSLHSQSIGQSTDDVFLVHACP